MSYILDALKKAERERGLAQVPTLDTVHDFPARPRRNLRLVSVAAGLCLIAALWLVFSHTQKDAPLAASATLQTPGVLPLAEAQGSRLVPAPIVPPQSSASATPARKRSMPATGPAPGKREPVFGSAQLGIPPETAPKQEPAFRPEQPGRPSVDGLRPAAPAPPIVPIKPALLREAVASMVMSVHLYSENKAERIVFINGKRYGEGDLLEPDCVLESITPEGAVLRQGEERLVLKPGSR